MQVDQHIRMIIIDSISTLITPILGGGGAQGNFSLKDEMITLW